MLLLPVIVTIMSVSAYNWYNQRYLWPVSLQKQLLGKQVVAHNRLVKFESYAAYGEGLHSWEYSLAGVDDKDLCPTTNRQSCDFVSTKSIDQGQTEIVISRKGDILKIQEFWL
jgi:hypothetical protein